MYTFNKHDIFYISSIKLLRDLDDVANKVMVIIVFANVIVNSFVVFSIGRGTKFRLRKQPFSVHLDL